MQIFACSIPVCSVVCSTVMAVFHPGTKNCDLHVRVDYQIDRNVQIILISNDNNKAGCVPRG